MSSPSAHGPVIGLLTHAPNDLTVLHNAIANLPQDFPAVYGVNLQTVDDDAAMAKVIEEDLAQARIIVLRVLGVASVPGLQSLREQVRKSNCHLIAVSGTGEPDPELAALSTVPSHTLHQVLTYFQAGGSVNLVQLLRYLSDHLLLTGFGFEPAIALPEHGIYHPDLAHDAGLEDWLAMRAPERPSAGIIFYRSHWMSGNTRFVDALIAALEKQGMNVLPVFTSSLRSTGEEKQSLPPALRYFSSASGVHVDVLLNTTSFAMGEITAGGMTPAGWSVDVLEQLDVPVLQAIASGMMLDKWQESARGLNPLDAAMNVVLPEFDGRIITVPISFKASAPGLPAQLVDYQPLPDRVARVAQLAARFARLRSRPNAEKRVAFVFTNSNSKASQIGNAVGLDAPASLMQILRAMQEAGYRIAELPENGTALIHELVDRCSYDHTFITTEQWARALARVPAARYQAWFDDLPPDLQAKMVAQWGEPPGEAYLHQGALTLAGIELGNAVVVLQPPRGYGMDPDAIYHQPDLPPTHHYYALYRWLRDEWGADAIVHVGKHGTLEWLPGKGVGLSSHCFPDALLLDVPLFYPFIINDPGEGAQAKRRAHAVVVDHLTPPLTTADTYGELAQLTQLVDEYYQMEILDPAKLPLLQQQIWELVKQTNLDADLRARLLHHDHDHDHDHDHGHGHGHGHGHHDHGQHAHHGHDHHGRGHEHIHACNDDHDHDHDHAHGPEHDHAHHHAHDHDDETLPEALSGMGGADVAHLIEDLDGYLCELGSAQIRDGLHILGQPLEDAQRIDMLVSLTRLPNQSVPGLQEEIGRVFGLSVEALLASKGQRLGFAVPALAELAGRPVVTCTDAVETIDMLARRLFEQLHAADFDASRIDLVLVRVFGTEDARTLSNSASSALRRITGGAKVLAQLQARRNAHSHAASGEGAPAHHHSHGPDAHEHHHHHHHHHNHHRHQGHDHDQGGHHRHVESRNDQETPPTSVQLAEPQRASDFARITAVLQFACELLVPNLARVSDEIGNLLRGLEGGYVPAGPSGAPTRGMAHLLPTGRNFYSVDPRSVPSQSAWRIGQQLAHEVLRRHLLETGTYPESVAISIWGTSAMRTHGDDVAQILSLLGVRPRWRAENRQLCGIEPIPLDELKRPRIDVTTRISGFFRDAFPQLIELIDDAVRAVIALDEPDELNFVRKHYLAERDTWIGQGMSRDEAEQRASFRIFGAKPGSYGAGILPLIQEKNWEGDSDFADAFLNWGGFAYGRQVQGQDAREAFRQRLGGVQIALHNQDNREHDIFDSDDYLQFHGGMIATIRALSGRQPRHYFGDSHDPSRAQVRDLKEETLRVFRSRVVNPKWLASIQRHGYKGGLELTATVDYLFGYDATAQVMEDWMYEQLAQTYAFDPQIQRFLEEANPWAQNAITERLLEAAQRGMWAAPLPETLSALREMYLRSETLLEARGETSRAA